MDECVRCSKEHSTTQVEIFLRHMQPTLYFNEIDSRTLIIPIAVYISDIGTDEDLWQVIESVQ